MGCWNHTCAISNLHISAGQRVAVFLIAQNRDTDSYCYTNSMYDPCPVPFYGNYDDYGGVEDCEGYGLPILLESLRHRLYEFGQGPNECHDCEVRRGDFDIEKLFEADHEGRLAIQQHYFHDSDEYDLHRLQEKADEAPLTSSQQFELDRLAAKIKKQDTFRRVTHVVIHGDIFDAIKEKWYIKEYVGQGKGTTGYSNSYNHIYFKDLIASIPEYVRRLQEHYKVEDAGDITSQAFKRMFGFRDLFDWNDECLAGRWLNYFSGSSERWSIVDVNEVITGMANKGQWEDIAKFVEEVLTAAWINSYMASTRKAWVKQVGAGSQHSEHLGYEVLANAMLDVLKAEKEEYGYDEDEDEDEASE